MPNAIRPDWVPLTGHQLHRSGVYFDAVRIPGIRGEDVAAQLIAAAEDGAAGPVVCEASGFRWMYFLLRPGTAGTYAWPLGVQRFGGTGTRTVSYIGIPALEGNTWPLRWYSQPTPAAPFVAAGPLVEAVGAVSRGVR
ncbi:hypothetical protein NLX86_07155 [Streptomyces sp. A3M-1-3]|uniref:hypothetical protein n=1 Tax=Streptomyces sp. A3M-1-3 TaxID=2962044 RepID=UPI0020B6767F|nr:hypothetical protein [Streptomyces sp. A3M-1-3]MCP3817918.1 hypothetical protein [Streptomyces sp. A3M-1-3]